MFFDILYNILIYPIEFIIEILFYLFNNVFKSSYGVSLFLLSLCINFLSLPLYNIAESWQAKERAIQDKMKPMIDNIKAVYKGDQRYLLIRACQRINGYKTIYAFRGTLGLLIQIPFFMAAYNFVHSLTGLNGQSFLFIKDLSKPDALIHIGNFTINLLPFLMTLFSLLSGFVYSKKLKFKESLPLYVVSLIFLVLLYTSPSGLLFYWTINCLFSLLKNIVIEYKLFNIFSFICNYICNYNRKKIIGAYKNIIIIISIIFLSGLIYINIFKNSVRINNSFIIITLLSIFSVLYILVSNYNFIRKIIHVYKIKLKNILLILIILLTFFVLILHVSGLVNERLILILSILCSIYILISNYNFIKKTISLYKAKFYKISTVLILLLTISVLVLSILGFINRKGFLNVFDLISEEENKYTYAMRISYYDKIFRNTDLYGVKVITKNLDARIINLEFGKNGSPYGNIVSNTPIKYIGKIEVSYILYIKTHILFVYFMLLFMYLFIYFINIDDIKLFYFKFKENCTTSLDSFKENRFKLLLTSCLVITFLSGFFIPTSLVSESPNEFKYPFYLIFNNFFMNIGLFLFYPLFIYSLFSNNVKNILVIIFILLASVVLINVFVMVGNYKNINADFTFDNIDLLKASSIERLINIIIMSLSILIIMLLVIRKKSLIIINIYSIVLLVFVFISLYNIYNISKEITRFNQSNISPKKEKIFNASISGENIFIFILDRAMPSHWLDALNNFPEYSKKFDGFVFYPNTVTLGTYTANSIMSIPGGYEYSAYELTKIDKFDHGGIPIKEKINEGWIRLPSLLVNYGYESSLLEPVFANLSLLNNTYTNIKAYNNSSIEDYALYDNIDDKTIRKKKIIRFSIFRMLPINFRYFFYQGSKWFLNEDALINTSIYSYYLLKYTKNAVNLHKSGNYYNILHNMLPHEPHYMHSDFLPYYFQDIIYENSEDLKKYGDVTSVVHYYANVASMNLIVEFIEYLKYNNIYDNTKIILVSDHGSTYNTTSTTNYHINQYNSLLLFKDFNSRGDLQINTNFMTIGDVPYLAVKHISNIRGITNYNKDNGVFITAMEYSEDTDIYDFFHVQGNILKIDNWKRYKMNPTNKEMIEVEFKLNKKK